MRLTPWVMTVVAVPSVAFAQASAVDVTAEDPARPPGFATLDRPDASSRFGIEASYLLIGNTGASSLTALRFDGHGQYVDPASGFGGYVQFPISYLSNSTPGASSQSYTGVGDLEVGGVFAPHFVSHGFAFVFRVGLTLPTGSTSLNDVITNAVTSVARLTDLYLAVPDGTSLRFGASALWRSGMLFARADLGADANLSAEQGTNPGNDIRINVGGGVALGAVSLTAESTNLYSSSLNTASTAFGSSWIDTGALAVRLRNGPADFYAAVVLPLDHESHNPILSGVDTFDAAITLGVEGRLR